MVGVRAREGKAWLDVDGRVDIALDAVHEPNDGVDLDTPLLSFRTPYFLAVYGFSLDDPARSRGDRDVLHGRNPSLSLEISETASEV